MSDLSAASHLTEHVDDSSPTSSLHSAFDPPGSPTPMKTKKIKKKKRKPRKAKKEKKHRKQVKTKRLDHEQPPSLFLPSRACAKMLVRAGCGADVTSCMFHSVPLDLLRHQ